MGSSGKVFIGNKAYTDAALDKQLFEKQGYSLLTPVKKVKNTPLQLQTFDKSYNELFSCAFSSLRQPPIELLFSW